MRVHNFRMWFGAALRQGAQAAKRAGIAVSRKARAALGKIEGVDGLADDETAIGKSGSRAWMSSVEEALQKVRDLLEKSTFVRIGKIESWVRQKLGLPPRLPRALPAPIKRASWSPGNGPRPLSQGSPTPLDAEAAAKFKAEVQQIRTQVNTGRGSIPPPKQDPDQT